MIFILLFIAIITFIINLFKCRNVDNFESENLDFQKPPFPIDVVYTWAGEGDNVNNIRTSNNDELKYSLRGIEQNLPWVNRIYILMNPTKKVPSWFKYDYDDNKVVIVDHYDTYDDYKYLPTTNSNSIETTLHKIPGLSEHFIYFNDDLFITKKLPYTHFFTPEGKSVLTNQMNNKVPQNYNFPTTIKGFYAHVPFPIIKSKMKEFVETYPHFIKFVKSNRTRKGPGCNVCTKHNLSCPCMQIQGTLGVFMTENGMAELKPFNQGSGYYFQQKNIDKIDLNNLQPIIVIQDTDLNPETRYKNIEKTKKVLGQIFPNKASFEQ